jgi:autotransporter-associated beta strand protein
MGGTGTLTLDRANTYSGDTIVAAGQLNATADGALGNGSVTVSNANLVLQWAGTNGYMSPSANLLLNGTGKVSLNFNGMEDIRGLSFDGGASFQPAGTYGSSISTATYKDDTRFDSTYAGILNVTAGATTNMLTASASPSVYGTPLSLTATVTPPGATGAVTFYDGTNWLGSAPLNGAGVAALSVNNLTVTASPHAITSVYGGDATHAPSTSGAVSQSTTAAPLTPNVVVAKVYDATTNATINSVSFDGILSLDTNYVSIAGTAVANFRDKDVGTGKPVDVSGLALAGSLSGNYTMSTTSLTTTGTITNKTLTVSGLTATNRVYDATLNENPTGSPILNGVISPEVVNLDGTAGLSFVTKMVGTAKPVTVSGLAISGADAGNYILVLTNLSANITASPISVGAITADNRVYDATTNATLSGTAALSPLPFTGDDVTLGGTPVAYFSNKTVGTAKAVTVKGYTISGADVANYTLSQPAGLTANITPVPTTFLLVSSMNPSTVTSNVTFTATITANPLPLVNDAPTGTIAFSTNGVPVASVTVVSNSPGVATAVWSTASLPLGVTPVLAAYLADTNYQASNMSLQQTVNSGSTCSQTNWISSVINNGDGTITLNFVGTPEAEYYVVTQTDAATALATWTTLGSTNKAPAGGLWSITVTNDGLRQFYRPAAVNACP